jgi:hypothetical protein
MYCYTLVLLGVPNFWFLLQQVGLVYCDNEQRIKISDAVRINCKCTLFSTDRVINYISLSWNQQIETWTALIWNMLHGERTEIIITIYYELT